MTDISVIILTGNEALHIKRCLEKLAPLEPRQVFVVESQKGDNTHSLAISTAQSLGWSVCEKIEDAKTSTTIPYSLLLITYHQWPGLYAKQFNWALDNLPIQSTWVLRLDADEYLTPETIEKLKSFLCQPQPSASTSGNEVAGLTLELKRKFQGGEMRHWRKVIRLARIWRHGKGRLEDRAMDEHLVVDGEVMDFDGAFFDDSLMPFKEWQQKHRGYAKREAVDALDRFAKFCWSDRFETDGVTPLSPGDIKKNKYYKLPIFLRPFVPFLLRYLKEFGWMDGMAGWRWHFWECLWYRELCDLEILKLKLRRIFHRT